MESSFAVLWLLEEEQVRFSRIFRRLDWNIVREICKKASLETIIGMQECGFPFDHFESNIFAERGRLDVIQALISKCSWDIQEMVIRAMCCRNFETAAWLLSNSRFKGSTYSVMHCCICVRSDAYSWLKEHFGAPLPPSLMYQAVTLNNLQFVKDMCTDGYPLPRNLRERAVSFARGTLIWWLDENGFP